MKNKGKAFKETLLKIRKLPSGRKKTEAIEAASKKYGTSIKTIYRELKKKPALIGVRDERSDAGNDRVKITRKELSLFDEKIQQGKTLQQAKAEIEKQLDTKISGNKLNKISTMLKTKKINDSSNYGSEIKAVVSKAWNIDEIGFGKTVNVIIPYNNKKIKAPLTKQDIEQIRDICAARINMTEFANRHKLQLDDNRLLRRMLKYLVAEQIQLAMETSSLASIDTLSLIANRLDDSIKAVTPDFEMVLKLIQAKHNPGITAEELLSDLELISEENKNA